MSSAHSILPLLSTILLLYSTATTAVSGPPIPVPIRDTDGDPVQSGTPYYITGALTSNGYGLHLIRLSGSTCRHNVELAPPEFGPKVVLYGPDVLVENQTINVNENLRISSSILVPPICDALWWLNEDTGLVTVGAIFNEVHNHTFRIVRHNILPGYYEILFWPPQGSPYVLGKNGQLLGRSSTPFIVRFQKRAEGSEVSAAMHSTA